MNVSRKFSHDLFHKHTGNITKTNTFIECENENNNKKHMIPLWFLSKKKVHFCICTTLPPTYVPDPKKFLSTSYYKN